MKIWAWGAALAVGLSGCAHAAGEAQAGSTTPQAAGVERPRERLPTDVRRATIIVRDMEKSLALYRDVIGLQVNYDTTVQTSGVALPAGEPGATARLVLMNANDPWVGWLGLMQWVDPPIPAGDYRTRMGPGDVVLILNTDDAAKRCEMVKGLEGITFTSEARLQIYEGRNGGPDIRVMGCNFFDPDGVLIELNQILND